MELVNDEDVETMIALYCENRSNQNAPIQLFVKLAYMESVEDPIPLGEEHGVQDPCMAFQKSYIDSQSTVPGINIDLNVRPENNSDGDDRYDSSDPSNHKVDSDSDSDVDEVPDDIN
ncbi:hypothetical protein GOBAR_AA10220 [Gossypium barbadense]|uniref:Uncharacterized protein n=1 Tax=Gossypium barbadense TaxID=3634 RepID=A0A2P5Y494_GOSBA|nr:hypothetical protein GOBAR_AA10220 [Gossypium barbadense]